MAEHDLVAKQYSAVTDHIESLNKTLASTDASAGTRPSTC
jgi:hypothetical protein